MFLVRHFNPARSGLRRFLALHVVCVATQVSIENVLNKKRVLACSMPMSKICFHLIFSPFFLVSRNSQERTRIILQVHEENKRLIFFAMDDRLLYTINRKVE